MAGSTGAIRAGRAFVELFSKDEALQKGLAKAKKDLQAFSKTTAKAGGIVGGAGASVLAPLTAALGEALGKGNQIQNMADKYKESTESISKLTYAFERMGGTADDADGAIGGLQAKIKSAADGNTELIDGLKGLNGRNLIGKGIDDQLDAVAEKIKSITNIADQNSVIDSLGLGQLGPILKKGKAGLDEFRASAEGAGAVMSAEDTARSKETMQAFNSTMIAVKNTFVELGAALLPSSDGIKGFTSTVANVLKTTREWIKKNKVLIIGVALISGGLVVAGAAILAFSAMAAVGSAAVTLLSGTIAVLDAVLGFTFSPAVLIIAGIAASVAILIATFGDLNGVIKTALGAFKGMKDAFESGDIELAWRIAVAAMKVEAARFLEAIGDGITKVIIWGATGGLSNLSLEFYKTWNNLDAWLKDMFVKAWSFIFTNFGKQSTAAIDIFAKVLESIGMSREAVAARVAAGILVTVDDQESLKKIEADRKKNAEALDVKTLGQGISSMILGTTLGSAQKELDQLLSEAGMKSALAGLGNLDRGGGADRPRGLPTSPELFQSMKGIFGGANAAGQLGIGDTTAKRQLDAAMATAENSKSLPEINDKMGSFLNGSKFK